LPVNTRPGDGDAVAATEMIFGALPTMAWTATGLRMRGHNKVRLKAETKDDGYNKVLWCQCGFTPSCRQIKLNK